MAENAVFKAFLSYAHQDAKTHASFFEGIRTILPNFITSKLINARLEFWWDKDGIRTGDRWDNRIEDALRSSHILIVLLSPRWLTSDYCRKELSIFEEVEAERPTGEFVAPILIQDFGQQLIHCTPDQKDIHAKIKDRQFYIAPANTAVEPKKEDLDKIADDIVGMLERLRLARNCSEASAARPRPSRVKRPKEFDVKAHNFETVDLITSSEILVEKPRGQAERAVYAQIGFLERMYVQTSKARVEFGVQRAHLSIESGGRGDLERCHGFSGIPGQKSSYYVALYEKPNAITICMDPSDGKSSLSELALPPAQGENYYSHVATARPDADVQTLKAEITITLCAEGLHFFDQVGATQPALRRKIEAILNAAATKLHGGRGNGEIRRSIPVKQRP